MEILPQERLKETAYYIARMAFSSIADRYGKSSKNPLPYHNEDHAREVTGNGVAIAELALQRGKVTWRAVPRVMIGGSHHDHQQGRGSGENERASVEVALSNMRLSRMFNDEDALSVSGMILATRVVFDGGRMLQSAPQGNRPEDYEIQILPDADVANLGMPAEAFWKNSTNLFAEMYGPESSVEDQIDFLNKEVVLLETHEFYTQEARDLFPNQPANLAFTRGMLDVVLAQAA